MQQRGVLLSHREREAAERWFNKSVAGEGSTRSDSLEGRPLTARRILLRAPNPLGDAVMAEPAMRAIAAQFPDAAVDVALPAASAALASCWSFARAVVPLRRGWADIRALRAGGYDLCALFPNSLGSALVARAAGIARVVGYARDARGLLLSTRVAPPAVPRALHMLAYYWRIAAALGCPELPGAARLAQAPGEAAAIFAADPRTRPALAPSPEMAEAGRRVLAANQLAPGFVVLAPGAAYGPAKQWPIVHYAQLAALLKQQGRTVAVVGTPAERPLSAAIDAVNLAGATDLASLIGVLRHAGAFVGNDSGVAHIAGALGLPGVVIYGSTSDAHSGQIGQGLRIVHLRLECSPCFARECPLGHLRCLTEITPAMVHAALAEAIA
jgi:heptosyltransferase-2